MAGRICGNQADTKENEMAKAGRTPAIEEQIGAKLRIRSDGIGPILTRANFPAIHIPSDFHRPDGEWIFNGGRHRDASENEGVPQQGSTDRE